MKLGDIAGTVATPVGRLIGVPCIDGNGNLRPESRCAKRKAWLNNFGDSVLTYFGYIDRGEKIMKYVITKQIEVEAETPEEAVAKSGEGKTISLNAQARPQSVVQQPRPGVQIGARP